MLPECLKPLDVSVSSRIQTRLTDHPIPVAIFINSFVVEEVSAGFLGCLNYTFRGVQFLTQQGASKPAVSQCNNYSAI